MCTAVFEGDVTMLKRLLHAGAPPGTADYDARTSLHIAAAEGNIAAVSILFTTGPHMMWDTHADASCEADRSCTPEQVVGTALQGMCMTASQGIAAVCRPAISGLVYCGSILDCC